GSKKPKANSRKRSAEPSEPAAAAAAAPRRKKKEVDYSERGARGAGVDDEGRRSSGKKRPRSEIRGGAAVGKPGAQAGAGVVDLCDSEGEDVGLQGDDARSGENKRSVGRTGTARGGEEEEE
ncbi:unnamed protein product, partial [Pylaiella littoralis]